MKRFLAIILTVAMLCTALPLSTLAFDQYVVYSGQAGCQLTDWQFTQTLNPWLLWDVTFNKECDGRVLETAADHPNLVGRTVIPSFTFEGDAITFNGVALETGVTEIVLQEENELVITTDTARAEYQISITEETNGLPVVLIDTDGADIPDKLNYVDSTISVLGADVYGGEDIYAAVAGVKLRGNSTMGFAKKPYRIKFDKKQNVFGLGKAKSWVLLANYLDPSVIRNQVAFSLANRINSFTAESTGFQVFSPRMRMVEVYLNGEYKGLYDMGDHMQANEIRVAVNEDGDEFATDADGNEYQVYPEGNVGYFIEVEVGERVLTEGADGYEDWSAYSYIENVGASSSIQDNKLYFQFKLPEVPSDEQIAYITDYMQTVNDLILAQDETVWEYLDRDSVIDWYLTNEIFKNVDSQMQSSCYLFKDKDGKLYMGPVWDFDLGAGAVSYGNMDDPTGWRTRNDEYCGWFESLFGMDSFRTAVNEHWAGLHEAGVFDAMFTDIDTLIETVGDAAADNRAMWNDSYISEINASTWLTVPDINLDADSQWVEQVQYLKAWLTARLHWMDEQFDYATSSESPAYVNFLSSTLSTTSSSKTFEINKSFNVQELPNIYLSVTSRNSFDITLNFDIGSPSLSSDWQGTDPLLPFQGTTGENIAAGTYTNVELNIDNYIPWSNNPSATTVTLNSITVTSSGSNRNRNVQITGLYASDAVQEDVSGATATGIGGTAYIAGIPEYQHTLRADTLAIVPYGATVSYQWYADGAAISGATASTFTPDETYIGKAITLQVTGTGSYKGTVESNAVIFNKYTNTYKTSQVTELISKTHDTIVVLERENYEISVDGVNWQTSGTFTELEPNTLYRVYYRHGENTTQTGGAAGEPILVITDVDPDAPTEPDNPTNPDTPTEPALMGDVDQDGLVNTTDAKLILRYLMGTYTLEDDALSVADYNGDGLVNTSDVRVMLSALVTA